MDATESPESTFYNTSTFTVGLKCLTPWRSYLKSVSGTNVFYFFNGQGGYLTVTNNGSPSYRGQVTCTFVSNTVPVINYPNGARDLFALSFVGDDTSTRYYLTQKIDPVGNSTILTYFTNTFSGSSGTENVICLSNIVDLDGRITSFTYTNISGYYQAVSQITDPYGHTTILSYDANANLTTVVDALQISSSMTYQNPGSSYILASLTTPYSTTAFTSLTDGNRNNILRVNETGVHSGVRNHLYLYTDTGDTNKITNSLAALRPNTTNATAGYSYANTFDSTNSNLRNTFY